MCSASLHDYTLIAGMSLITHVVILEHDSNKVPPSHQEVIETGQMKALDMHRLVKGVIEKLAEASVLPLRSRAPCRVFTKHKVGKKMIYTQVDTVVLSKA